MAWTAPSNRSVGELITATIWNEHMGATGNEVFLSAALAACSGSVSAPAFDTNYQNLTGKLIFVNFSMRDTGTDNEGECAIVIGATSSPVTEVAHIYTGNVSNVGCRHASASFIVPVNWYYKFVKTETAPGDLAVDDCYITTLH